MFARGAELLNKIMILIRGGGGMGGGRVAEGGYNRMNRKAWGHGHYFQPAPCCRSDDPIVRSACEIQK
jgi:hypothetical protein